MFFRIDLQSGGNYVRYRLVKYPINKLSDKFVNDNVNEVASNEDLVFALQNNMILVEDLVTA